MRSMLSLSLLIAAGCTPPTPVSLAHKSELQAQTRGLVLGEQGGSGTAGMLTTTCEVYTDDGSVAGDFDMPTDDERVVDAGENDVHGKILVGTSDNGVHVFFQDDENWGDTLNLPTVGVVDAKVHPDGVAVVWNDGSGCQAGWFQGRNERDGVWLGDGRCGGGMQVDSLTGRLWVGGSDEVTVVDRDGSLEVVPGGELIALDEALGVLYTARRLGSEVRALSMEGEVLWTAPVDGEITALDDMGALGAVAVMVEKANGLGEIVFLDGLTGQVRSEIATPAAAEELTVSRNGRTLALTLPGSVQFYEISERK